MLSPTFLARLAALATVFLITTPCARAALYGFDFTAEITRFGGSVTPDSSVAIGDTITGWVIYTDDADQLIEGNPTVKSYMQLGTKGADYHAEVGNYTVDDPEAFVLYLNGTDHFKLDPFTFDYDDGIGSDGTTTTNGALTIDLQLADIINAQTLPATPLDVTGTGTTNINMFVGDVRFDATLLTLTTTEVPEPGGLLIAMAAIPYIMKRRRRQSSEDEDKKKGQSPH